MFMLIDRDYELEYLDNQYNRNGSNFIVIYGRRRIGKTYLINEFCKNKPTAYFLSTQENSRELIKAFSIKLSKLFNDKIISQNPLTSWSSVFEYLVDRTENLSEKIIIVIDEITYIIMSDKSFLSIFQKYYDLYLKARNIMFILSGSLINIVYNDLLGYSSPLYGRRTGNLKLDEFRFCDTYKYFNYLDFHKTIAIYSLFGGIPYYLSLIDNSKDYLDQYLSKGNIFYNDVEFILREELSNPERYFTILKLIASGKTGISEISSVMGYKTNELSPYVEKLISLDIIKKEYPIYNKKRNNGLYKINSNYFNFYFNYIFENKEYIDRQEIGILKNIINKNLKEYISRIFEDICTEFLIKYSKDIINADILKIGRWWGKTAKATVQPLIDEIDIMGEDSAGRHFFCEVKYRNRMANIKVLEDLKRKSNNFHFENELFIIFSESGFEQDLVGISKIEKNVILIDGDTMARMIRTKTIPS